MKSILQPSDEVFPVSVYLNAENEERLECKDLFLSVPVKFSSYGVKQLLDFELEDNELEALKTSARIIKRSIQLYEQIYSPD